MTDVRGMVLSEAEDILRSEGFDVVAAEVRSKKGVPDGNDKRVIRVLRVETDNTVYLAYSIFKTAASADNTL